MAVVLSNTDDEKSSGVTIVVYGGSGVGKTRLVLDLDNPILINADQGTLSLKGEGVNKIDVETQDDIDQAINIVLDPSNKDNFGDIMFDSISEAAQTILVAETAKSPDPRKSYPKMADSVKGIIRKLRRNTLGKDVVIICEQGIVDGPDGMKLAGPLLPGNKLGPALPYLVDEIVALRAFKDADGKVTHAFQCLNDGSYSAKDRSGKLEMFEEPDMGKLIKKIKGEI